MPSTRQTIPGDAVAAGAALNVAKHTAADGRLSGAIDKKQNDNRKPVYLSLSIAVTITKYL